MVDGFKKYFFDFLCLFLLFNWLWVCYVLNRKKFYKKILMNELIIKSFLINTYSLICLLPKEIENISISVKKINHDDLFNKTLVDIKNFSPLFTKEAIQESLNNAKSLNGNECQIYLSALEDKFKNITKASEVIFKNDSSFIKRVEFQKEDLLNKFE